MTSSLKLRLGAVASLLLVCIGLAGCGTPSGSSSAAVVPPVTTNRSGSKVLVGDFLYVSLTDIPALAVPQFRDQKIRVPDDGMITLPYNVRVQAAGKTYPELQAEARTKYVPDYFKEFTII